MITLIYCLECRKKILHYGLPALEVFEGICEHYLLNDVPIELSTEVHFHSDYIIEVVRFLELKGFVLSTEVGEHIISVKPLGYVEQDNGTSKTCLVCFHDQM